MARPSRRRPASFARSTYQPLKDDLQLWRITSPEAMTSWSSRPRAAGRSATTTGATGGTASTSRSPRRSLAPGPRPAPLLRLAADPRRPQCRRGRRPGRPRADDDIEHLRPRDRRARSADAFPREHRSSMRAASTYPFRTSPSRQNPSPTAKSLHPESPLPDSNRKPLPYHGSALPTELRGRSSPQHPQPAPVASRHGRGDAARAAVGRVCPPAGAARWACRPGERAGA